MRRGFQLALFGGGPGRGQLFDEGVLRKHLSERSNLPIPNLDERAKALRGWLSAVKDTKATESSLEGKFVSQVLANVLGYTPYPGAAGETATLYVKPGTRLTGIAGTPDVALGLFTETDERFRGVLELKTPGFPLDRPQARDGGETPVEQAFGYGSQILGVNWVLVSDMLRLRLYSVESEAEYEEVDLSRCLVPGSLETTDEFLRLYWLFHASQLVAADEAPLDLLRRRTAASQLRIRDGFYQAYYRIRMDLLAAIREAVEGSKPEPSEDELLLAAQRLLDRLLFLFYCEDHPEQLIPRDTVHELVAAARRLPGADSHKIYRFLKGLFREVDEGSPSGSGLNLLAYNGELFKEHPIIDHIDLPDSLASRRYVVTDADQSARTVDGVWGLHVYDFWRDLNEHLLGHIFEESLSDLVELRNQDPTPVAKKLEERKQKGIFYTSSLLADFLSSSALSALLAERAPRDEDDLGESLSQRIDALLSLRIIDTTCGSGAFLVSAYRELLLEYWRTKASLDALREEGREHLTLDVFGVAETVSQASLLRDCLFGIDMLPQATEIAKLALWLRSSRKGEKVSDLSHNIIAADSLDLTAALESLETVGPGDFDLVIGNPPWGAEMDSTSREKALALLGLSEGDEWDSWELFTLLGLHLLREGGRLAYVLPDSFFYTRKARLRRHLTGLGSIEKVLNLGPDWFGSDVRMSTVLVQVRKGGPPPLTFQGTLLAGRLRSEAIAGEVPLTQVEAQRSRELPSRRMLDSEKHEIEVFRGQRDDQVIATLISSSSPLAEICDRGRGEEVNKAGLLWVCPSCLGATTPGAKEKGGGYKAKKCPTCGHLLDAKAIRETTLVSEGKPQGPAVPYLDGDDLTRRYSSAVPTRWFRLDQEGWPYKPESLYEREKILVRQAGVGLIATLDKSGARVPQSVYVYRLTKEAEERGISHEFVLGALLSRTMTYLVFKRFAEIDPAKAHAKLTHSRLAKLPIPKLDLALSDHKQAHERVREHVSRLLAGDAGLGGADDLAVELELRKLWGLTPDDGAYINGEFFDVPDSQAVRDLFPDGAPRYRRATSPS